MARTKITVDRNELEEQIRLAESSQVFSSHFALYNYIANTDWARNHIKPLTPSVIMLRIKEFNIAINTQKGVPLGIVGLVQSHSNIREDKIPSDQRKKIVHRMMLDIPEKYHKLIKPALRGSAKAAIKLKCLDCTAFQKKEIALCECISCPLWTYRPYKA